MSKVKNGDFVQLHYTGTLEDGSVFDSSDGRPPLEFQVGAGGIIQGFNDAVIDMALHEEKKVVLAPDQAYGDPKEDLKRDFPASMLEGHPVEVGQQLRFSSPHGPVSGTVLSIEPEKFVVDFNHPLAGKTLAVHDQSRGDQRYPHPAPGRVLLHSFLLLFRLRLLRLTQPGPKIKGWRRGIRLPSLVISGSRVLLHPRLDRVAINTSGFIAIAASFFLDGIHAISP